MKNLFTALFVSIAFIMSGCGSDQEDHSHGEDGDHTHETPVQQSSGDDGEAVRIGSSEDSTQEEGHSHDEDSDHQHDDADANLTDHDNEEHAHDENSDHDH
jgi:zinc transport system substrate-binding protein